MSGPFFDLQQDKIGFAIAVARLGCGLCGAKDQINRMSPAERL
jgi:hypothetical protein